MPLLSRGAAQLMVALRTPALPCTLRGAVGELLVYVNTAAAFAALVGAGGTAIVPPSVLIVTETFLPAVPGGATTTIVPLAVSDGSDRMVALAEPKWTAGSCEPSEPLISTMVPPWAAPRAGLTALTFGRPG